MNRHIREQARVAIEEADLVIFMVDGQSEITSSDRILSDIIKKSQKSCILVVNKIDSLSLNDRINDLLDRIKHLERKKTD